MGDRILLVDDDDDIRATLGEILTGEGYDVSLAANGAQALNAIDRDRPDVVLLDLMMPVLDGWQTLKILQRDPQNSSLPVIVLSAAASPGCCGYVPKPISLARLLTLLETIRAQAGAPMKLSGPQA
jgi:CheY-like chemotaxis protein